MALPILTNDMHVSQDAQNKARTKHCRPEFDFSTSEFVGWHRDGVVASHFFNALSLFFPTGEKFFIHSVKNFSGKIAEPRLTLAVRLFITQEASHSNEHRRYLVDMIRCGYKIEHLDVRMFSCPLASVEPSWRLSMTVAMEHFTASLSRRLLHAGTVQGDPTLVRLWHWHACEELEHQSVAFDVYERVFGTGSRAYCLRAAGALRVTWNFLSRLTSNFSSLLCQELGKSYPVCYMMALHHLWVAPGILRVLVPDFLAYFLPSFRPDRRSGEDQILISAVRKSLEIPNAE